MSFSPVFLALLGIALNPLLAEFPYPPIGSVVLASLGGIALVVAERESLRLEPWLVVTSYLVVLLALSLFAQYFGANQQADRRLMARIARVAASLTRRADSRIVLSPVLIVLLFANKHEREFSSTWWVLATLAALLLIGGVDWEQIIAGARQGDPVGRAEAMVAPSRLVLTVNELPDAGKWVAVESGSVKAEGVVVTRIPRRDDVWGEIHLTNAIVSERLLGARTLTVRVVPGKDHDFVGSVDVGSSDATLRFVVTKRLEVLTVVRVPASEPGTNVYYQVTRVEVEESRAKGGAQLVVRATAKQVGRWDPASLKLLHYRWVPEPGAPVFEDIETAPDVSAKPVRWLHVGNVIGTRFPIFLDLDEATSAHMAVLGMTKMGKTTFAMRLAKALAVDRRVVVLDQTGQYLGPLGLPAFGGVGDWLTPGLCAGEPVGNDSAPSLAERTLREATAAARAEYLAAPPIDRCRSLFIDEAHQFVPEPAGMDFRSPDRDASVRFGSLAMQVRKYRISLVLISQRTAVLAKTPLTQCENLVTFRTIDQTGLEYVEAVAGADVRDLVPALRRGEALLSGPAFSSENPVAVKLLQ